MIPHQNAFAVMTGLDAGLISPALFTMMVVMALVTTAMTAPLLDWLRRSGGVPAPA
ncbi:MAG: hypothetical protein ABIQ52_05125 [Vicinamibacterales bacterium]